MYIFCSPCILNPALRAEGITKPSDVALFERVIERCREFEIEMVPLPCPETLYLGPDREPGTFLERLNTPEFSRVLARCIAGVNQIVAQRGPPLAIVGVNSSPTCGVTATYYGSEAGEDPKREGRGVFLSEFPEIDAFDVREFGRFHVYLAAPLFSESERMYNKTIANLLRENLFSVYLPQEAGDDSASRSRSEQERMFLQHVEALERTDLIVAVIDGADADSGTSWEVGYAYARKKPVIALRTDFRHVGTAEKVNLMLEESSMVASSREEIPALLRMATAGTPAKK
ncbi:MAG: hypothetical protein METHP_00816 [Methanoregula sp. SKADARSKE-2]|nr:MAG: hypothetical protein METHP_00816 [Methanoregula sp. SKADARSKE-2]